MSRCPGAKPQPALSRSIRDLEPLVQAAVPLFPIARPGLNGITGVESLKRQSLQFFLGLLVFARQALDVLLYGQALGFGSRAQAGLNLGLECDAHHAL